MNTLVMDIYQFGTALYRLNGCKSYAWNSADSKNDTGEVKFGSLFGIHTHVI